MPLVHLADHGEVGHNRAAVEVVDLLDALRLRPIRAREPGPVRRIVVDRQEERILVLASDELDRPLGDEVREVALPEHLGVVFVQVVVACGIAVSEVVHAARERAEELLVAALQRPEVRRIAEMPLAHECGGVTGVAQERRQRRVRRRQAQGRITPRVAPDGLVGAAAQAMLPAAGHQREACRRTDG